MSCLCIGVIGDGSPSDAYMNLCTNVSSPDRDRGVHMLGAGQARTQK